jgi:hypothetical protein
MNKFNGHISRLHWSLDKIYNPDYNPSFQITLETLKHLPNYEVRKYIVDRSQECILHHISPELIKIEDELIDMSLAQHSPNGDVLETLYNKYSDAPIGLAALKNKSWKNISFSLTGPSDLLIEILADKPIIQAIALLNNPKIYPRYFAPVLFRTEWADSISDQRYLACVSAILSNPMLKKLGDLGEHNWVDCFWNLFELWPVNNDWTELLWLKLAKDKCYLPTIRDDQLKNICRIWTDENYLGKEPDSQRLGLIRGQLVMLAYSYSKDEEWFLFNEDSFIREGYQRGHYIPPEHWNRCYELDNHEFLHNALTFNYTEYFGEVYQEMLNFLAKKSNPGIENYEYVSGYKQNFEYHYENREC